jgi:hypothetical protein
MAPLSVIQNSGEFMAKGGEVNWPRASMCLFGNKRCPTPFSVSLKDGEQVAREGAIGKAPK